MKVGIIGCGAIANIITTSIVPEENGIDIAYFFDKLQFIGNKKGTPNWKFLNFLCNSYLTHFLTAVSTNSTTLSTITSSPS